MGSIAIGDYVEITVRDPASPGRTLTRNMDERAFSSLHVLNKAVVHDNRYFIETLEELKKYHRPEYVYNMPNRYTWNYRTYEVALAICNAYPIEPFQISELDKGLVFSKQNKVRVHFTEFNLLDKFNNTLPDSWRVHVSNNSFPDGLLRGEKASAFFTTWNGFEVKDIRKWHAETLWFHHYQQNSKDERGTALWKAVFSKPVYLYAGFRLPSLSESQIALLRSLNIRPLARRGIQSVLL